MKFEQVRFSSADTQTVHTRKNKSWVCLATVPCNAGFIPAKRVTNARLEVPRETGLMQSPCPI